MVFNFFICKQRNNCNSSICNSKNQILNISQNINPKLPIKTGIWKNTERMNEIWTVFIDNADVFQIINFSWRILKHLTDMMYLKIIIKTKYLKLKKKSFFRQKHVSWERKLCTNITVEFEKVKPFGDEFVYIYFNKCVYYLHMFSLSSIRAYSDVNCCLSLHITMQHHFVSSRTILRSIYLKATI